MAEIQPELLDMLVCPLPECHGGLRAAAAELTCTKCGRRYPVEDGWPVLIPEEARDAGDDPAVGD